MLPVINFKDVLNAYIDKALSNIDIFTNGFILDKNNSCQELVLSALYQMERIYNSRSIDFSVKENILSLWNKLK